MPSTAQERSLRARVAAEESWANTLDRAARTKPAALAAVTAHFETQIDPGGELEPADRARRAQHLTRAHLTRLKLASVRGRRIAAESIAAAEAAEIELAGLGATVL